MTDADKINLKIENTIFYIKKLKKKIKELCVIYGKPEMTHSFKSTKNKIYCYPISRDCSTFTLNKK